MQTCHLVLIPTYNTGPLVLDTVREALRFSQPVWVVVDGSTDGSGVPLQQLALTESKLKVLSLPENRGKGGAVLHGIQAARSQGFTHVLTMDADGQHPAARIPDFIAASAVRPEAMILGDPIFDSTAPSIRVKGRRISNWWARFVTLGADIGDSLFGFRVYPIEPLLLVMRSTRWMRRFDFDPEAAVRLSWLGVPVVNLPAAVRYLKLEEGGVSHFRYWRDNVLLTWMYTRLMFGFLLRLPILIAQRNNIGEVSVRN